MSSYEEYDCPGTYLSEKVLRPFFTEGLTPFLSSRDLPVREGIETFFIRHFDMTDMSRDLPVREGIETL